MQLSGGSGAEHTRGMEARLNAAASSRAETASPKQKGWDVGKNKGGIRLSDLAERISGWWRWGL